VKGQGGIGTLEDKETSRQEAIAESNKDGLGVSGVGWLIIITGRPHTTLHGRLQHIQFHLCPPLATSIAPILLVIPARNCRSSTLQLENLLSAPQSIRSDPGRSSRHSPLHGINVDYDLCSPSTPEDPAEELPTSAEASILIRVTMVMVKSHT
jgi:hypothetical protein